MISAEQMQKDLAQFYGSMGYTKFMPGMVMTDGTTYLVKNGCHWLLTAIWSHMKTAMAKDDRCRDMQFWTLQVNLKNNSAVLTCEADSNEVVIKQEIEYTDFPLPEIKIWLETGYWTEKGKEKTGMVAMLPNER